MAESVAKKTHSGRVVVIALGVVIFGMFFASLFVFLTINPLATLHLDLVLDCRADPAPCDLFEHVELDDASVKNFTLLNRSLDAFDNTSKYHRAHRTGANLTFETTTYPAREVIGFLRDRLVKDHPGSAVDGQWTRDVLLLHHGRLFRLSMTAA